MPKPRFSDEDLSAEYDTYESVSNACSYYNFPWICLNILYRFCFISFFSKLLGKPVEVVLQRRWYHCSYLFTFFSKISQSATSLRPASYSSLFYNRQLLSLFPRILSSGICNFGCSFGCVKDCWYLFLHSFSDIPST